MQALENPAWKRNGSATGENQSFANTMSPTYIAAIVAPCPRIPIFAFAIGDGISTLSPSCTPPWLPSANSRRPYACPMVSPSRISHTAKLVSESGPANSLDVIIEVYSMSVVDDMFPLETLVLIRIFHCNRRSSPSAGSVGATYCHANNFHCRQMCKNAPLVCHLFCTNGQSHIHHLHHLHETCGWTTQMLPSKTAMSLIGASRLTTASVSPTFTTASAPPTFKSEPCQNPRPVHVRAFIFSRHLDRQTFANECRFSQHNSHISLNISWIRMTLGWSNENWTRTPLTRTAWLETLIFGYIWQHA